MQTYIFDNSYIPMYSSIDLIISARDAFDYLFFYDANITTQQFRKLQGIICSSPLFALKLIESFPNKIDYDICESAAIKVPKNALYLAITKIFANKIKCQEAACKDPFYAFQFALQVPNANIDYCQKKACKKAKTAYFFAIQIPGANIKLCLKAVQGTDYEEKLNLFIMNKACK